MQGYDCFVVNTSGGKDSQTCLRQAVQIAAETGTRVVAIHADLGHVEWPGTKELAQQQCDHYGVPMYVVKARTKTGEEHGLLDYVRKRQKWPSSTTRYCTSDFKRTPCSRVFTWLTKEFPGRPKFLNIFGFRAEESPARAKRLVLAANPRLTNSKREVWDWLPIHEWTEEQVWADIKASGVPYHPAYDLGMPRLSCSLCIFAPRAALLIAGKARPELLQEYVEIETEIGHTFRKELSLKSIQEAIQAGEQPATVDGAWNM